MAENVTPEAIEQAKKALEEKERTLGPEHADTAASLYNLAALYGAMGEYAKAEPLCKRALRISEQVLGPEHANTASCLNNLAELYRTMGACAKAEPLCERALRIWEKTLGPEHPRTATGLNNLALLYEAIGDYAKAEPLYERALKIWEKVLGSEHPKTATGLNNLAGLYYAIGDCAKAEPLYERALKIREQVLGPEHPDTAEGLNNLAGVYVSIGDCAKAEPLYVRGLEIREKVLGPEHPNTATSLNNLAAVYVSMGECAKAEPLYERALKITEMVLGPEHPSTAMSLNNLAGVYVLMGDCAKAEPLYERAVRINEKVLGPEHLDTATSLYNLAIVLLDTGNKAESVARALQAQQAELKMLENVFSFAPERQRLAYQETLNPYSLLASLNAAAPLALAVLRYKGVVLDSLLEDRLVAQASDQSETRALVNRLRALKHRLTQLVFETPKDLSDEARQRGEEEKKRLTQEAEQLEGALARHLAGLGRARRSLSVTVEQVQAAIPGEAMLLELLRYNHYLGKNQWEQRYGVIVLASSGEPQWVCLGSAEAIEQNVKRYQEAIRGSAGVSPAPVGVAPTGPKAIEVTPLPALSPLEGERVVEDRERGAVQLSTLLQTLYQQLWSPLEPLLPPETKTVILSPDGALNFLSFATLLTPDNQFLSQKYSIRYVASGRDLLREFQVSENAQVTVFANPDFGGPSGTDSPEDASRPVRSPGFSRSGEEHAKAWTPNIPADARALSEPTAGGPAADIGRLREMERRDFANLQLPPLPGTARESALLAERARQWNWPMRVFEQAQASKSRLHAIQSPRILHLATHGFFLPDGGAHAPRVPGSAPSPNPGAKPVSEPFSFPVGEVPTGAAEAAALPATDVEGRRGVGGLRPFGGVGSLDESENILRPRGVLKNPMHRSGLALAGAQATLDAWNRGETPPSGDDGIVTAAEVGTLKLEGTELVALSACETGAGEAKSGEGVLGLRRGFIQAGAQNLLMTLWSVADDETAQIMAEFYEAFHASGNAPKALANVQRDWLVTLRKERGLQAAVNLAGPFIMTFQGSILQHNESTDCGSTRRIT